MFHKHFQKSHRLSKQFHYFSKYTKVVKRKKKYSIKKLTNCSTDPFETVKKFKFDCFIYRNLSDYHHGHSVRGTSPSCSCGSRAILCKCGNFCCWRSASAARKCRKCDLTQRISLSTWASTQHAFSTQRTHDLRNAGARDTISCSTTSLTSKRTFKVNS